LSIRFILHGVTLSILNLATLLGAPCFGGANAGNWSFGGSSPSAAAISPALPPFQHVRFCLRYPSECKSDPTKKGYIDLNTRTLALLKRVNRSVNISITPARKSYGSGVNDGWTIAPDFGDCNDYSVTKRHELAANGMPSGALRLAVVTTASGIAHLVLLVVTTKGDFVMDNLTEALRPWQSSDYHWLKIQSGSDPNLWHEINGSAVRRPDHKRIDELVWQLSNIS
jgi:predicted transglutaminase-like cysteine proteinase